MYLIELVLAGNNDRYQDEEVTEEEGQRFIEKYICILQLVYKRVGIGIDELFIKIGEKFINLEDDSYKSEKEIKF